MNREKLLSQVEDALHEAFWDADDDDIEEALALLTVLFEESGIIEAEDPDYDEEEE